MGGEARVGRGARHHNDERKKDQSQNAAATQPANRAWLCLLDIFTCIYDEYNKRRIPPPSDRAFDYAEFVKRTFKLFSCK